MNLVFLINNKLENQTNKNSISIIIYKSNSIIIAYYFLKSFKNISYLYFLILIFYKLHIIDIQYGFFSSASVMWCPHRSVHSECTALTLFDFKLLGVEPGPPDWRLSANPTTIADKKQ